MDLSDASGSRIAQGLLFRVGLVTKFAITNFQKIDGSHG